MAFFNFSSLNGEAETHRDIFVDSLDAEIRILKLNALQLMPILQKRDTYPKKKDNTLLRDEDTLEFCVSLCALSAANQKNELQFDSPEGREWLETSMALFEMVPTIYELNQLESKKKKGGGPRKSRSTSRKKSASRTRTTG